MLNDVSTSTRAGIGCALAIALCLVGSCQPAPSRTPLGSGELAQAEAARTQRLQAKLAQQRRVERWGQLKNTPGPTASAVAEVDDAKSKESDEAKKASAKDSADAGLARVDDAGANAGDAGAVADFAGEYRGSDTMTLELPGGVPPQAQTDPKAILRVEQADSELTIIIVDSSKGSDMCSILADALGKRATIRPDQRCFEEATSGMNGTVEQGTVELEGDKIRVEFEGEIEIVAARLTAPASYSFEGKRNK